MNRCILDFEQLILKENISVRRPLPSAMTVVRGPLEPHDVLVGHVPVGIDEISLNDVAMRLVLLLKPRLQCRV